ncbi:MAG: hypothetical protein KDA65_17930, partial [Planctomycetaceae bacterium]|nr:hypothetical protein [Planctomycetaceae bacterium]
SRYEKVQLALEISKNCRARFESRRPYEWRLSFALWVAIGTVLLALMKPELKPFLSSDPTSLKNWLIAGGVVVFAAHLIHLCCWIAPRNKENQDESYAMEMVALNLAKDHDSAGRIHEVLSPAESTQIYKRDETGPQYTAIIVQLLITSLLLLSLIPIFYSVTQ